MQFVRSFGGSVSKTWNSINSANLSGACDVIVVEQEDGTLACSPFHIRFGKFSLLRPFEKKVEFKVNGVKRDYAMKLGEEGEAFFVFGTSGDVPTDLQTSPVVSPATSPASIAAGEDPGEGTLQEPEFLDLSGSGSTARRPSTISMQARSVSNGSVLRAPGGPGDITPVSGSPPESSTSRPASGDWSANRLSPRVPLERSSSAECLPLAAREPMSAADEATKRLSTPRLLSATSDIPIRPTSTLLQQRSNSPPPVTRTEAINRAIVLSQKLSNSNISNQITESGDLMLDMTGYKSKEEDALRAELIARKILAEELKGNYDIGALIGADEQGNLWIYSSEEAKDAANRKVGLAMDPAAALSDAASDPGYRSDDERAAGILEDAEKQVASDRPAIGLVTPPQTPPDATAGDPNVNYAKTIRLTSDQLKGLNLQPGPNRMSFTVNRATCQAHMHYWQHNVPVVISDIDGTITKSDALGHMFGMIGRDWTHPGVAKLYKDIVANGYNIFYLTSRSIGQADTTRAYLDGISQDSYQLPKGPVVLSPDRTFTALRRELYIRKPEVFKMRALREILDLYGPTPPELRGVGVFYAGFGNRLTDALSYRAVHIPPTRIFTINAQGEVALDLLTMGAYRSSYVSMREVVDHFFPPVGLLVRSGGEECTDFSYWRARPLAVEDFTDSESEAEGAPRGAVRV